MRDYSKMAASFWTGATGRALRGDPEVQVVATYLITGPHATMIGVYTCPSMYVAHETGLTVAQAERALRRLEELEFCMLDRARDLIWVREMARFQIGEVLSPGDRRVKNVAAHFAKIPSGIIRDSFASRYGAAYHLPCEGGSKGHTKDHSKGHQTPENAPSKPCEHPEMPLRSQEQEQEQDSSVLTDGPPDPEPSGLPPLRSVFDQPPLRLVSAEAEPAGASDPTTPERDLFARAKAVAGSNFGGQVSRLLKAKGGNIALARAAVEMASTKQNPREYLARVIRGDDTGLAPGQLYDRSI